MWYKANGETRYTSGNDRKAYANMAAQVQNDINHGRAVSPEGYAILEKARYIGVAPDQLPH